MSFFQKLFNNRKNKESNFGIDSIDERKPVYLIYANEVFSHGWNDPSEIKESKTSIILDVVYEGELLENKLNYWNKKYYDFITQHYSISESQLESISSIIGVESKKYRELYAHWPKEINEKQYAQIFEKLKLKFVQAVELTTDLTEKFAIVFNEDFWNIKVRKSNIQINIINTYERTFDEFELIHKSKKDAVQYGIIIYDRLCLERPPDTDYYYHKKINDTLTDNIKIPSFNYNFNLNKIDEKQNEYSKIIAEKNKEILYMENIYSKLSVKPFKVVQI